MRYVMETNVLTAVITAGLVKIGPPGQVREAAPIPDNSVRSGNSSALSRWKVPPADEEIRSRSGKRKPPRFFPIAVGERTGMKKEAR